MEVIEALTAVLVEAGLARCEPKKRVLKSRYGGPVYLGEPDLQIMASFMEAGGGPTTFSASAALAAIIGEANAACELEKLIQRYGKERVDRWLLIYEFALDDAAGRIRTPLPDPNLKGADLARFMVLASRDRQGTLYTEHLLDKSFSHALQCKVMHDVEAKFGRLADRDFCQITNQALFDLSEALKLPGSRLAKLH